MTNETYVAGYNDDPSSAYVALAHDDEGHDAAFSLFDVAFYSPDDGESFAALEQLVARANSGDLRYVEHTTTIIVAPEIGSADTEHGRLSIVASGSTVRFALEGVDGCVDLNLANAASAALAWLASRKAS